MSTRGRLFASLAVLFAVYVCGTIGFVVIEGDSGVTIADAAYMTAITLSTVGFKEVVPLSGAGRLWTVVVIVFGVATVSFAFTLLNTLFISGAMRERRKMQSEIEKMRDHVILCGYGRMGALTVAELRKEATPVVVIERSAEIESLLAGDEIPCVIGDATEEETLLAAGLHRARALVAALPHDADNVYVTLTAHTLCPELQIIARAELPSTESKLERAGASRVICPQIVGARKISNILHRPNVVDFVEVAAHGGDLEMDEYVIGSQSALAGATLQDSLIRQQTGAIVVAIKRADGETLYNPKPEVVLAAGDTLIIVGKAGVSDQLSRIDPNSRGRDA